MEVRVDDVSEAIVADCCLSRESVIDVVNLIIRSIAMTIEGGSRVKGPLLSVVPIPRFPFID